MSRYREALETRAKPDAVVDLRLAAAEADAGARRRGYAGELPSMAHNAIDWLTRRWRRGALHDKPLAVVGPSAGTAVASGRVKSRTPVEVWDPE